MDLGEVAFRPEGAGLGPVCREIPLLYLWKILPLQWNYNKYRSFKCFIGSQNDDGQGWNR
jgi:hypothetical protein